ncbi:MAG: hypothetical protein U1E51_21860 [Candidatus Binatia bacterium]|nr:hypothetical protein [Candidatus Binatia bacterium]
MKTIILTEEEAILLRELIFWSSTFSLESEEENAALQALYVKLKMMLT